MKNAIRTAVTTLLIGSLWAGCASAEAAQTTKSRDIFYQAETLQSLMLGNYTGFVTVADIKQYGDIGLGTFEGVDGEMIVLDGVVYQAKGDGQIVVCADDVTSPFCSVTWFDADSTKTLSGVTSMDELKQQLDACIAGNRNILYAAKLTGRFDSVIVRSEKAQQEPYLPLAEVLKTDQVVFPALQQVSGTVVAVYFPDYMDGVNTPGWHLHFISDDRQSGGHVMDIAFESAQVQVDATTGFLMMLPDDARFASLALRTNLTEDIAKVEGGKQ